MILNAHKQEAHNKYINNTTQKLPFSCLFVWVLLFSSIEWVYTYDYDEVLVISQ